MKKAPLKPLTRMIARYIRNVTYRDIPQRILDPLRQSIADGIGCGIKGSTTDFSRLVADYVSKWGTNGEATIWGTAMKASAPFAAMVNCASTHAWDYDDAVFPGMCHSACVVVPTALAIAERAKAPINGKAFVAAIAAGYEVSNLIGTALGSKAFASSGFYNSVPTIFGSVTTAAKLMKLNEEQLVRAIGLAATQSAGLYSATLAKRFNAPKAVEGGIFAADLAQMGLEGPPDPIEAEYSGFVTTFSRTPDLKVISRDLGKYRFEIFHKFYPCIRSNQPTVENVRLMLKENPHISAKSIRRIVSHVDKLTIEYTMDTTAGGAEGVKTPGNALISLPYCVAAMVVDGELTFRQFEPARIRNSNIQQLMRKIELRPDPSIDKLLPTERYRCTTEIHLIDGRVIKRFLPAAKGDPANRLTLEEMHKKFMTNATSVLTDSSARRLFNALESIEQMKDVRALARPLFIPGGATREKR
ncbi:MAG: MmgE/PrpD family protein [Betaproteobacteria bacterium]|nr:MmgE/PrpD family protein [Betaproteobacteria bacterium]